MYYVNKTCILDAINRLSALILNMQNPSPQWIWTTMGNYVSYFFNRLLIIIVNSKYIFKNKTNKKPFFIRKFCYET